MKILSFVLSLCLMVVGLQAQTSTGLIAYYNFDNCNEYVLDDNNNTEIENIAGDSRSAIFPGVPECVCGVEGSAIRLNGFDQEMLLLGSINNYFELGDFTISFYMKSINAAGTQSIVSFREMCEGGNRFGIRFNPLANTIIVELSQEGGESTIITKQLDFTTCWQHISVVRSGGKVQLYINGSMAQEKVSASGARINIRNNSVIYIGGGACVSEAIDNRFAGILDELRIYDRALPPTEVVELYASPDKIITVDTTIFLGSSIDLLTSTSCATEFTWTPGEDLSNENVARPEAMPEATTTYKVLFNDGICTSTDSVTVTVIDPAQLGCSTVYLPKAFTPNNDNINDEYGISNPNVIDELISFEIFDRWGAKVFSTDNAFERWDGSFKGAKVNPGVMLYRVSFKCDGEELNEVGSFTIIR